jgi:hypothetical protein
VGGAKNVSQNVCTNRDQWAGRWGRKTQHAVGKQANIFALGDIAKGAGGKQYRMGWASAPHDEYHSKDYARGREKTGRKTWLKFAVQSELCKLGKKNATRIYA